MIRSFARRIIFLARDFRKKINTQIYKGDKFKCPFCGYSSNKLSLIGSNQAILIEKDVSGGKAREGGCFNCGSKDRHRLVWVYLNFVLKIFESNAKLKILHMAPEKSLSKYIQKYDQFEYVCGDLAPERYGHVERIEKINLLSIPYSDNHFDLVICNHLLEHIPNDKEAMKEILRVLKPGGKAIMQVPISLNSSKTIEDFNITDPNERIVKFGQSDHVRIYGQDYPEKLKDAGFDVSIENLFKDYSHFGLNDKELLYIGSKNL